MNLTEFQAQGENEQKELTTFVNGKIADAVKSALAGSKEAYDKRVESAMKYLNSDAYDSNVKELALKVIKGEATTDTLDGVVAFVDANKEKADSNLAKKETEEAGEIKPQELANIKQDEEGQVSDEESYQASIKRMKNLQ